MAVLTFSACTFKKAEPYVDLCPNTILYQTDVKPLIDTYCVGCHTTGATQGDFNTYAGLKAKVDNQTLNNRLFLVKDMPPGGNPQPTEAELQKIKCWVEQGALDN